jgi:hypothetical protein
MERERRIERSFWTVDSEKDSIVLEEGDDGKARNPRFAGLDCAYGNPRDKPPRMRGNGRKCCKLYSRENGEK